MKNIFNFGKFTMIFIAVYYGIYILFFSIKKPKGDPLIAEIQNEIYLRKNLSGRTINEFPREHFFDLLFVGSSHCYRSFDPEIFTEYGMDAYNLGTSSQAPVNSYSVIKIMASHTRHILMEVYPEASNLSGAESFFDMASSIGNYSVLFDMAFHLNNLRCYNILSIKPLIDNYNKDKLYEQCAFYKGYVETSDSSMGEVPYEFYELKNDVLEEQFHYIKKIIALCLEQQIKISFVYAPIPPGLKITGEKNFIRHVESTCSEHGVEFYNFGRRHKLNSSNHFFDDDHMNKAGVRLFNEMLIQEMKNRNDL